MKTVILIIAILTGLGFILPHFAKADIIPFYRVVCAENFELPDGLTFRLHPRGTETTAIMIYTTSGAIRYNVNESDPATDGGFTLNMMQAIVLSYEQADAFRAVSINNRPTRLFVLHLDMYP